MKSNITHRRALLQIGAIAALSILPPAIHAQSWPARPVTLVVPFPAGGIVDNVSRSLLPRLTTSLGQPLIIENKAGAGGSIGTAQVAKARPDGYTLLMAFDTHMVNPLLYKLTFDSEKDLTPVALIGTSPLIVVVPQGSPINTLQDLVATAKKRPGALAYASTGPGSSNQLATELFKMMTGTDMMHVPYKGGAPAITDTLAARVDVMFVSAASVLAHIKAGKLKPLAVTTRERIEQLPEVPAVHEFFPGYEAQSWIGMLTPSQTPADIVKRLNTEVNTALQSADIKTLMHSQAIRPTTMTPENFGRFMHAEGKRWAPVIQKARITVD